MTGQAPTIQQLGEEIIKVASRYVGLYETISNAEWTDKKKSAELVEMMTKAGWQKGWPYCQSFCESVWREAYENMGASPALMKEIFSKLNPSSVQSRQNFQSQITKTPVPGAIFFMQKGTTGLGHAGIVESVKDGLVLTIEANTSPNVVSSEKDREGDGIFRKSRALNFTPHSKLFLVGFLNPIL